MGHPTPPPTAPFHPLQHSFLPRDYWVSRSEPDSLWLLQRLHSGCFRDSSLELKGFSRLLALGWSQSFLEDSGETLFLDRLAGQSTALPIASLWHTSAEGQDSCFLLHEAPICIIHGFDPTGRQERGLHRAWGLWLPSTTP